MTKEEIKHLIDCVEHLISLIPKSRKMQSLGAANELFLYLEKQKREIKP